VAVGGICISFRLAAIFTRLKFARLLCLMRIAGESPGYASLKSGRPTFVHCCGIGPASCGIYPQNMYLVSPPLSSHR
jgi:hypothetical protein